MNPDVKYLIGLLKLKGVGSTSVNKLVQHYGSAKSVFEQLPADNTTHLKGISQSAIDAICSGPNWLEVEKELSFIEKNKVQCLSFMDEKFPRRLKFCADAPALLYYRGEVDFNHPKILAVVGTRRATPQGKKVTDKIITDLVSQNVLIISGLAFGIDIVAHQSALTNKLPTIGVLAHGLDRVYPSEHRQYAREIENNGAMLTEFTIGTKPDRENFPKRNRIVAGMADAILVIESQRTGGSMITADLGFGYGRDVFAIPGRPGDTQSQGCNFLIRQNKASLVESATDIKYLMNWREQPKPKQIQKQMFVQLSTAEEQLINILTEKRKLPIDELCLTAGISISQASVPLLTLELNGMVRQLPGKIIELI